MPHGIFRAAVLYNFTREDYVKIDAQTIGGEPSAITWTWVASPADATRWVNVLELQYYLTDTPLGDPSQVPYPWEIKWMYFSS